MSKSFQLDAYQSPDGWVNTTIKSVVELVIDNRGKTPPLAQYGIPLLEINSIYGDVKHPDPTKFEKFVSKETYSSWFRNGHPEEGDILIATVGAAGASAIVNDLKACIAQNLIGLRPAKNIHRDFLFYITRSQAFKSQVNSVVMGGVQPSLKVPHLLNFNLHYPASLKHQAEISKALSDIDKLINILDQLIAKKRNIQQATMQQLLTGQRRLPGFSGGWEEASLGEISFISKGEQLSQRGDAAGLIPHFNGGVSASSYTDTANTPEDTIAISEGGNSCGFVQFITTPFWCGGHCYAVRPRGIENLFLYFALKRKQDSIMGLRVGSGLPNIQKSALNSFQITLPGSRDEQTAIATTLADMDSELAALESRRQKACQVKQGMMQELLTGRIRLGHGD